MRVSGLVLRVPTNCCRTRIDDLMSHVRTAGGHAIGAGHARPVGMVLPIGTRMNHPRRALVKIEDTAFLAEGLR
jgi:hypothetical protein